MCFVIDDVSISGFKDALNEQISTEGANVSLAQEADEAQSPDAISAASQSIDEPTKDLVISSLLSFLFSQVNFFVILNENNEIVSTLSMHLWC